MIYRLGRVLQFLGLLILPVAVAGEMSERLNLKQMLLVAGTGAVIFFLGWLVQQAARRP